MDRNVGPGDRIVRIILGIGIAVLLYVEVLEGAAAIVAGIIAVYLLLTALMRRCVAYKLAGVDTNVEEQPYSTTDDRSGL